MDVKHSTALGSMELEDDVRETIIRGKADAVIVSGRATGIETSMVDLKSAKAAAGSVPVLAGSGVTVATVADTLRHADGAIVGTGFKAGGITDNPVDEARVRALLQAAQGL